MLTFKEFLLAEYDQAAMGSTPPSSSTGSQTNVTNTQLKALQLKQQALLKRKADLQQKFDSDMQRSQSAINAVSEDQAPNPVTQPQQSNPGALNLSTADPQMQIWKQKQQAAMRLKADGDKQIDSELKRTQGQIDALTNQQQKQSVPGGPTTPPPVSGMGTMGRSGNPEKTTTPSGAKTTQTIAPSARVGFGASFS